MECLVGNVIVKIDNIITLVMALKSSMCREIKEEGIEYSR